MFKKLYIKDRLFYFLGGIIILFVLSYSIPFLSIVAKLALIILVAVFVFDFYTLRKAAASVEVTRQVVERLSLSDSTTINYSITNTGNNTIHCSIIDELPEQLQIRNFNEHITLTPNETQTFNYHIRPVIRGEYHFQHINTYVSSPNLGLVEYKAFNDATQTVKVIPSVEQMKKYELQVHSKTATLAGIRKIRKIGDNDEFEHIRAFTQGDNIKAINWKATSRRQQVMLNQYQDSRSQMVFSVIDKGRSMKMPFNDLTLLDYAINSVLATSNIILKNYDKAGLITFSNTVDHFLNAQSKAGQLERIADALYHQQTDYKEPNYEALYFSFRRLVKRRSVVLLYTNFENKIDLQRQLKYLKGISKHHLLIVICFINSEVDEFTKQTPSSTSEIYAQTMAGKLLMEKEEIMKLLQLQNIQTILTKPEDLSIDVINKYLEIKSKRMT